jgi:hypothetical protein
LSRGPADPWDQQQLIVTKGINIGGQFIIKIFNPEPRLYYESIATCIGRGSLATVPVERSTLRNLPAYSLSFSPLLKKINLHYYIPES